MTHDELLEDIRRRPEAHRHTFEELKLCCFVDGAISLMLIDAHEGLVKGPDRMCDVTSGQCACGVTH